MLSIEPWTLFWTLFNVLVLFLIMKKFLFTPVMNVINAREEMVKKQFDSAKENLEQAEQMKTEYQAKLENAKTTAEEIVVAAKERAEEEKNLAIAKTQEETAQMIEKAKADILVEQERAQQEVQAEIAKLAISAARKIMETGDLHDERSQK